MFTLSGCNNNKNTFWKKLTFNVKNCKIQKIKSNFCNTIWTLIKFKWTPPSYFILNKYLKTISIILYSRLYIDELYPCSMYKYIMYTIVNIILYTLSNLLIFNYIGLKFDFNILFDIYFYTYFDLKKYKTKQILKYRI